MCFYYFRDRGESEQHGYKIHWLEIFVSKEKQKNPNEINDYYYSGGIKKLISLNYQKGHGYREPQTDIEKAQDNRYYSETIESTDKGPSAELFKELMALWVKMEKAQDKLISENLAYEYSNDLFLNRVFLLKRIGAEQIEYSSQTHNYYLSGC